MKRFTVPERFLTDSTKDMAMFLFQQAEKRLIETLETEKLITDRSYRFLSMLIPAFIAIVGLSIDKVLKVNYDLLFYIFIITAAFISFSIFQLYKIIRPKDLMLNGSDPRDSMKENLIDNKKDDQIIGAYLWECENYNERIEHNRNNNTKRLKVFNRALNTLKYMVITNLVIVLCFVVFRIGCYYHHH